MRIRQVGLIVMMVLVIAAALAQPQTVEAKHSPPQNQTPAAPSLGSPANGAVNQPLWVSVTWNTIGTGAYRLQVSTDAAFASLILDQSGISGYNPSRSLSGLLARSTTYYWRMKVTLNGLTSGWSEVRRFTTASISVPPAPVLVSPANNATNVSASPTVVWEAAPDATYYYVTFSDDPFFGADNEDAMFVTFYASTTSLQVNNLLNYLGHSGMTTTVYWKVMGINSWMGPWSATRQFTIDPGL
jgi:hypothetical protein